MSSVGRLPVRPCSRGADRRRSLRIGSSFGAAPVLPPSEEGGEAGGCGDLAHLVAARVGAELEDVTCAGVTVERLRRVDAEGRFPQTAAVSRETVTVTVTAGGNDVGFLPALTLARLPAAVGGTTGADRRVAELTDPARTDERFARLEAELIGLLADLRTTATVPSRAARRHRVPSARQRRAGGRGAGPGAGVGMTGAAGPPPAPSGVHRPGRRTPHAIPLHVSIDEGEGPTVVLIHGIASSPVTFQNVVPLLKDDHRLVAVDLLGFGRSPAPVDSDYSIEEHVRCLETTFKRLHLPKRSVLVGHSMGALFAARLAAQDARRVRSLVLVSPPIYLNPEQLSDHAERRMMDIHLRAYRFIRANPRFSLRAAHALSELLPIKGAMTLDEAGWTAFVRSLERCIESQTALDDLARVTAPIDMVVGSMDEFASEETLRIVGRLQGVTTHRVRGSDHLIGHRLARVVAEAVRAAPAD